ncbi:glycosyltransferase family 2 protein [Campylobacter lari]|uniref:glycosyltransferase family 2 protein n=2 Tax=Campylobacter lari TaxID=201 RepID=UPI000874441E|nr:glycosyltransferase family 2 protein [Campylobacter lari]EAH4935169.1 glycosyltransferase family 2 protein [Campylobacter lari]EAH7837388.1 glycosyltransferase family 2 protein [Campylobacter lari]EAI2016751.1 glycosyltransferase family 2 protein [Campylobacter lari]EAI2083200.1 glycosyltransferase family 2 protein [Campylobacter lari]EAI2315246.1 glycosyltransferase family 2 protein [Campylobacter lari]
MSQISIILPTYNVEKYIARALDSCINQSFEDIEIIVVDDNGSDKSIDIAKEYASKDKRIKIIHNEENLKLLRARCEGVKVATSPYIMFLDPDDYLELNACEECINNLTKDTDLLCFNYFTLKQSKIQKKFFNKNHFQQEDYFIFLLKQLPDYQWSAWGKIYNRKILLTVIHQIESRLNNTKLTMAEDAVLYMHYLVFINQVTTLSKCLCVYNCNNMNSSTKTIDFTKKKSYIQDLSKVIILIQSIQNTSKYYQQLQYFAINQLKLDKILLSYHLSKSKVLFKLYLKIKRKILLFKINNFLKTLKKL